ncbi:hypothetical protein MUCCIDRAFT_106728 [Mucor lusitanicus CBS 277.49]|uniref:Uncharacterized protein n=1 Tax=Mucor lusitanicus CBS 277.49 TaxID=747725 RepID=A0A168NE97_MUCCL|nr:hypothetical protein MUCCIDRAFT_106728 [Mucor lusitanicus CBS 277.49]
MDSPQIYRSLYVPDEECPHQIEAILPANLDPVYLYNVNEDGQVLRGDTGRELVQSPQSNSPQIKRAYLYLKRADKTTYNKSMRVDKIMVFSYYDGHRYVSNNVISNLAPMRSLNEIQGFMRWLLEKYTKLEWRVARTKE